MALRFSAIVLAAGFSSRMGKFKPLLPLGETTLLERILVLLRDAGIEDIRVVIGHRADEMLPLLEKLRVRPVVNSRFREGMFSSVEAGVKSLDESCDAFFLLPVDVPLVRRQTLIDLMQAYGQDNRERIIYPAFCGERGHPPLISASYRGRIIGWHGEGGLKALLMEYDAHAAEVEVVDEYILCDVDSPEDYQRVLACWTRYGVPTNRECEALCRRYTVEKRVWDHSRKVAELACCIGRELNREGLRLDLVLIEAGALLHDLARGRKDHAEAGAAILRGMGYAEVAELVSSHMDITVNAAGSITAQEVVYLADKLAEEDQCVTIEARFRAKVERYAGDPEIQRWIARRLENALMIKMRVEDRLGRPVETVLGENDRN